MESAEVVIVGGGVIGASVAYHLAAGGCADILVLESGLRPGEGSTGKATGGFRAQFSTPVNVRLSLLARAKLSRFAEELGVDAGYRQCGYLFVAREQAELSALHAAQDIQKENGLAEALRVCMDEVMLLNPALNPEALIGGAYCPTDGFIRPLEILRGYTEAAQRLGVRFEYGQPLKGLRLDRREKINAVITQRGEIAAGLLVNAAGAWAARVAQWACVDLPVKPLKRQAAITYPCDLLPEEMPMTIFACDGFHLCVRDKRVLLLWPDQPLVADLFDTKVEDAWIGEVLRRAQARVPCLRRAVIDRLNCLAGLYEMSPDRHAILGRALEVENLYFANGSSGHGVMHAPALGQLLSEIILDGAAHTMDTHDLRPSRFAEGRPNLSSEFL
ncbi:MAG TPA: FAD-binding oxidoreductase [Pyrinomonadaceae bacterium]|jgi:sarcosine oxidase subunit beta|nr:FAD-binding oxidoreductase [Pyrinomonadaceae bacterium]